MAAIPIAARETLYGAVLICADRTDSFGEHEIAVQTALGRVIANATSAVESKRILTADNVITVGLTVTDLTLLFVGISAAADCRLEYSGSSFRRNDRLCMLFDADGAAPERIETAAEAAVGITTCTCVAGYDEGDCSSSRSPRGYRLDPSRQEYVDPVDYC